MLPRKNNAGPALAEMAEMAKMAGNGGKWREMAGNIGGKLREVAKMAG